MKWEVIDRSPSLPEENMQMDQELLLSLKNRKNPVLHFYDWIVDSATFGYFTNPSDFLNLEVAASRGLKLAKRPTGGGVIFHAYDFAFSLLLPSCHPSFSINTLENYAFVNQIVIDAIKLCSPHLNPYLITTNETTAIPSFCMVKPTVYDVVIDEKKVAGAAQRRTKEGFLHQGSICLMLPQEEYLEDLISKEAAKNMLANSFSIVHEADNLSDFRLSLRNNLISICNISNP